MNLRALGAALGFAVAAAAGLPACKTDAFCFQDCETGGTSGSAGTAGTATGGVGGIDTDGSGGTIGGSGGTDTDACTETNQGIEICDSVDNDCNGKVDDLADWTTLRACGSCALRCDNCPPENPDCGIPKNVGDPTCQPPAVLDGTTPGTCKWTACLDNYYDIDDDPSNGCEYRCDYNPDGANTTDFGGTFPGEAKGCGFDDDCDGEVDEDVNLCNDPLNCGNCGSQCVLNNASSKCVSTAAAGEACTRFGTTPNTRCEVDACDTGFVNADGVHSNGCEYKCTPSNGGVEICDGIDNDCDNKIDNADADLEASEVGDPCWGGGTLNSQLPVSQSEAKGVCALTANQGVRKCIGDKVQCCDVGSNNLSSSNPNFPVTGPRNGICNATTGAQVVFPGEKPETCNNQDDDCDGVTDNDVIDEGSTCGSSVGGCVAGTRVCDSANRPTCKGADCFLCVGNTPPAAETCNAVDDDCDGVIDGTIPTVSAPVPCTADTGCPSGQICLPRRSIDDKVCALPTPDVGPTVVCDKPNIDHPPAGTEIVCKAGNVACVAGQKTCVNSVTRDIATPDSCGKDENCDGVLTGQPDKQTSLEHCGACGNNCLLIAPAGHGQWTCNAGVCQRTGCEAGFIDCDSDPNTCEKPCTFLSSQESCNGVDDDCDCQIDENVVAPSTTQVCGVGVGTTDPNCLSPAVNVNCVNGAFQCTFPAGYCTGTAPNQCANTADICDGKDNNCNGTVDDNFRRPVLTTGALGDPCSTPATDGACQGTGSFVCNSTQNGTVCNAVKKSCTTLAGGCTEACDAIDNDCDGVVDETYTAKGSDATNYVKPAVTQIGTSLWVYQYEASRPGATATNPGSGNGFQSGAGADQTKACSVSGVIPWFNVTPTEVEQTCTAMGGRACTLTDWQTACKATVPCTWGYAPRTGSPPACTQPGTYGTGNQRICNIGPFDVDNNPSNGVTDGLLPTASTLLSNCWADWSGLQGNTTTGRIFDITGNLREITKSGSSYTLMGGAFNTQSEAGATCDFTFFTVSNTFKLFDVGFRCCFDQNPG